MVNVSGLLAPRLSRLIVDSDFNLKGYRILNLGAPQQSTDAARKQDVDSAIDAHRSASPLDHPDRSVTRSKLDKIVLALILQYL